MAIGVYEGSGVRIVEGMPGASLMRRPQDATLVLEACFAALTRVALLYPENLTPRFFDLSSGEAGEVLDKLRRFQVRLAIVCSPGTVQFSSRFREILSDDLRIFEACAAASGSRICAGMVGARARGASRRYVLMISSSGRGMQS
jgi:hypothetical protein